MTTPTTVNVRLQLRADTAANWTAANPTLLANEVGLETDTKKLKVGDGSTAWASLAYFPSIVSGGTVLGNLEIGSTGTLTFEGSTADGFETTLAVTDPTADRTITLPNQSGTVVVSGNASIVDADIAAGAEIAVSKLANGTANQVLVTDGTDVSWSDDLTLAGNLTVNGTTTTINTQDLLVEDKNIIIGNVTTPDDTTANAGGITLKGATDKTINWYDATDAWTSSERFSVPLGSAASPSLTFTGDENTGIYSPGADQLALSTNGTGRLFVDADGRILINQSSVLSQATTQKFEVKGDIVINSATTGAGAEGVLYFSQLVSDSSASRYGAKIASVNDGTYTAGDVFSYDSDLAFSTTLNGSLTEKFRITRGGNVGIGTTSPGNKLHIVGGSLQVDGSDPNGAVLYVIPSATPSDGASLSVSYRGTGAYGPLKFSTGATERARIDSSGRLLVGTSSARTVIGSAVPRLQIEGTNFDTASASITRIEDGTGGPSLRFAKSRATYSSIVNSDDTLGTLLFSGADGSAQQQAAAIAAEVDGTPGANDMPGRLVFSTTADGASSPTERMRIDSDGLVTIQNTAGGYLRLRNTTAGQVANDVVGSVDFYSDDTSSGGAAVRAYVRAVQLDQYNTTELRFGRGPVNNPVAEGMRLNQAGELLIGYTSDNGAYKLQVNSQIFATSATIATSDGRYKENVATLNGCVDLVKALRPVSFDWKTQAPVTRVNEKGETVIVREAHNFPSGTQVGFIAQEVESVLAGKPWLGSVIKKNVRAAVIDADGTELAPEEDFLGIAEGNLVAVLTSALQEAIGEIESLKARVAALESA